MITIVPPAGKFNRKEVQIELSGIVFPFWKYPSIFHVLHLTKK